MSVPSRTAEVEPGLASRTGRRRLDAAGGALLALTVIWVLATSRGHLAEAGPPVLLLVSAGAAVAVGRWVGRRWRTAVPLSVATAVLVVSVQLALPGWVPGTGSVLGYDNADAALLVQGIGAAGLASVSTRRRPLRRMALGLAVVLWVLVLPTRSVAGLASGALLLIVVALAPVLRRRWSVVALGLVPVPVAVGTVLVGSGQLGTTLVDDNRRALWVDAVDLAQAHAWTGIGTGRFAVESSVAAADADLRWAHSLVLQQAAEQGLPGLLLLVTLLGWVLVTLCTQAPSAAVAAIGAASVAAFGVQACVDHVADFPAVTLVAALLVGVATASGAPSARTTPGAGKPGFTPP